jgi:hypothetical protein
VMSHGKVEVLVHSLLTSTPDGDKRSAWRPGCLTLRKKPCLDIKKRGKSLPSAAIQTRDPLSRSLLTAQNKPPNMLNSTTDNPTSQICVFFLLSQAWLSAISSTTVRQHSHRISVKWLLPYKRNTRFSAVSMAIWISSLLCVNRKVG